MAKPRPTEVTNKISLGGLYAARHGMDAYVREYNAGWAASRRPGDSEKWNNGTSTDAWDDGYLDYAAGREKWHLTRCPQHGNGAPGDCNEA